jgi:glycoside/pentoside/hexuronide:cation symporter, GPH family
MTEKKHLHWEPKHEIAAKDRVAVSRKLCYGAGGLSDFFIKNTIQALAIPIFAVGMGLDPFLLGLALAATKIISAFMDPVAGILSDKTRTRWGRRKPYLIGTAVIASILLPFVFRVPDGSQTFQFGYIFAILSFYFLMHSFYAVPYYALGFEMTDDYDERTNIFAWKNYICMAGVLIGTWSYWFTLRPCFGNEMNGAQVLGAITSIIIIAGSILVTRGTEEIVDRRCIREDKMPAIKAIKTSISNKSFLIIQGAVLVVALGLGVDATIGMYLHVHYTCAGDKAFASVIGGFGGTASTFTIFFALAFATWFSRRWGKRATAILSISVMLIASISIIWFMSPVFPWLIVIVWIMNQFGAQSSNLIYESMIADICDEDELKTGERREGSYAAARNAIYKLMEVAVLILSGWMPRLAGYIDTSTAPNFEQLERMKFLLISTDVAGISVALIFLFFYPLSRKRCTEIRSELDARIIKPLAAAASDTEAAPMEKI